MTLERRVIEIERRLVAKRPTRPGARADDEVACGLIDALCHELAAEFYPGPYWSLPLRWGPEWQSRELASRVDREAFEAATWRVVMHRSTEHDQRFLDALPKEALAELGLTPWGWMFDLIAWDAMKRTISSGQTKDGLQ
jgi:hypothetical protein